MIRHKTSEGVIFDYNPNFEGGLKVTTQKGEVFNIPTNSFKSLLRSVIVGKVTVLVERLLKKTDL